MDDRSPPERIAVPMLRQRWESVTFLHWRHEAAEIQRFLPRGVRAEEIDGSGWISVTALVCLDTRLGWLPAVPGLSDFPETNVRTYVETLAGPACGSSPWRPTRSPWWREPAPCSASPTGGRP